MRVRKKVWMMNPSAKTCQPPPLRIGNLLVDPPLVLAPMAGVTDQDYRSLMARHGAGMVTTEMVSAKGILQNHPETWKLCIHDQLATVPLAVQLFASCPSVMAEAARRVEGTGAAVIDINAGCPVKKVVRQGAGASLLREPDRLASIVDAVKKAVAIPVTVKIRIGWDSGSQRTVEVARMLVNAGVDAICIHGRTATQKYSGRADWSWIARVKGEVSVPVIGNGDVNGPVAADRMLRQTGCDAVMIGRASQGNPWLLQSIASLWYNGGDSMPELDWTDYLKTVADHVESFRRRKPRAVGHCRMLLAWYSKACPESSKFRGRLAGLENVDRMLTSFHEWVHGFVEKGVPFLETKVPDLSSDGLSGNAEFNLNESQQRE